MENIKHQAGCEDCPIRNSRDDTLQRLSEAVIHYDYCTDELFRGQPVLSDIEEEMVRGLLTQQSGLQCGDKVVDIVRLVGSIAQSGGEDNDFFVRVISWYGLEGQKTGIANIKQEIEELSCGNTHCW
jgi:hypothetical protein